ncbi:peroxiredoxin [Shimia abyssi]|uniref:Glutathione-dependent peroxiredoxin n=1 Tax=Shimia abyssi TaxID=1662395 RepID=A0A2P8FHP8_9RHOB|nr:peroxiredoxin [Shimia abyssi]PSL21253.1 thiol peroxidase (atypical 2-Cys peroxiredoxin) [Shimia abyssi]
MTIEIGTKVPNGTLMKIGADGPEPISVDSLLEGRKVVLFGLPGAFTGTCTSAHLPSFMRTAQAFRNKGVDEIVCVAVNDPFVMDAWDKSTNASDSGITMLTDPTGELVKAMDLGFSVPEIGFLDRSRRFSALVENGELKVLNVEESPGVCELSAGETLLHAV